MNKPFKIKNPYPVNRKGKINPNSEGNTDMKDGRSKSSAFQNVKDGSYKQSFEKSAAPKSYKKGAAPKFLGLGGGGGLMKNIGNIATGGALGMAKKIF